jgi:hypothetical protein
LPLRKKKLPTTVAARDITHHQRTPMTISRRERLIKPDGDALRVLVLTMMNPKNLKSMTVSSVEQIL